MRDEARRDGLVGRFVMIGNGPDIVLQYGGLELNCSPNLIGFNIT